MSMQQRSAHHPRTFQHMMSALFPSDWEGTGALLADQAVLPEQFHDPRGGVQNECGEVALMRAVLADAINCYQRRFVSKKQRDLRLAEEAEEWFFADDHDQPFSFVHICLVLGLEPAYIRLGLRRWGQDILARPQRKQRRVASRRQPLMLAA